MVISGALVTALLTAIAGYTGYAIPGTLPHIRTLPHDELSLRVCGKPCGVIGFTTPQGEILLDDSLQVGRDPGATSILVHELTHFLQIRNTSGAVSFSCQAWQEREREAYDVQHRWLKDRAPSMRVFSLEMVKLGLNPVLPTCTQAGNAANDTDLPATQE